MSSGSTTNDTPKERILKDPRALLQHVDEFRRTGRHKEAIAACLEGLVHHPNLDALRITLGRAYLESGQIETARDTLQEVFARLPEHHLAGKLLAEAQNRLGDHLAAAGTCRDLLRHYPRDRDIEALLRSATEAPPAAPPAAEASAAPALPPDSIASDPSLEYRPEDLVPATPAATTSPAAPRTPAGSGHDALQTNTLAELYVRQGLTGKALGVYRGMLRVDPGNEALMRRVQELERPALLPPVPKMAPLEPEKAAIKPAIKAAIEVPPSPPARLKTELPPHRRTAARLKGWLAAIQAARTPMQRG